MNRNDTDGAGPSTPSSSEHDLRTLLLEAYPNAKELERELVPQLAVDAIKIRYAAELYFNKANIAYRLAQDRAPGVGPSQQDYDRWNAMSAEELLAKVKERPENFNRTVLTNCAVHRLIRSLNFDIEAYDKGIRKAGYLEGVHTILGRIVTLAAAGATFGVTEAVDLAVKAEKAVKFLGHVLPTSIINPQITGRFRIVTDVWERTKRKGGSSVLAPNIQKARWMSINYGELKKLKEQLDPLLSDIKAHVDAGNPIPEDLFKRLQDLIKAGKEEAKRYKETANWNKTNTWSKGYGGVVNLMGAVGVVTSIGMPVAGLPILAASIPAQWFAGKADEKNKHEYNFRSNLESGDILTDEGKSVPVMDLTVDHIDQKALRALQKPFAVDMVDLVREIYQNELGELKRKISKRAEKVKTLKKPSASPESGRAPSKTKEQKISSLENEIAQLKKRFDEILPEAAKFESFDREQWRQLDGENLIGKCLDNTKYLRKKGVKAANNRPGEKEAQILQRYFQAFAGFASLGLTTPISDLITFIDSIPKPDATNAAIGVQSVGGAVFTATTGDVRTQKAYNKGALAKAMEHVAEVKAKLDAEKGDWTVNIDINVPGQQIKQYKIDLRKTGGFNKYFHTQRQRLRRAARIILPNLLSPPKGVWNALKARSMLKALKTSMVETGNTLAKAPNLIAPKHEDGRVQRKKTFAALTEEILSYQHRRTLEEPSYSAAFKNNFPDENQKAQEEGRRTSTTYLGPESQGASTDEVQPETQPRAQAPFLGYVAYPFAGEAPDFDSNATKGASQEATKNLAPDLEFNDYATHQRTVLEPMMREFEDRLQRAGAPGRMGLKAINYLNVYRNGAEALEDQLVASGIKIPPQVNKNTFVDHEHIKNNAGSKTYLRAIRDSDPALKNLPLFHLWRKKKEEAELVRYKRLRHFALYKMSDGVESLRDLYEIDPSKREPVLKRRFASIDQLNEFFQRKFDGFQISESAITKPAKEIFSRAETDAQRYDILESYLRHILDHLPYGGQLNTLARNSIQEEFDQARYASNEFQTFTLSDGSECRLDKDDAAVLRQPYGNKCELRIDKGRVTFTLEGHPPEELNYVTFAKVDQYFDKDILASLFKDKQSRTFDDVRRMTFGSLYGRLTALNMRQAKIEALVNEPFRQAVDRALEGVINFHGTGNSYNAAHYGEQHGVEHRNLFMGLVIDKARRGELFISGSCGFQQELVWHSGGHIIALQDITGKTFLASPHGNDPYEVEVKHNYASIERYTDTAGVTEKPIGQFEDGSKAWAPRDVKPLVIELGMDRSIERDADGNPVESFGLIKASLVRFQGQPVLASQDLQQRYDPERDEYAFTRPLKEPLRDDEGNAVVDENGDPVLEQEKITVKMLPQTITRFDSNGEAIEEQVETPLITGIERWVRVPLQDDKGDFKTKARGNRMLCAYQKVVQDGSEAQPINPEILLDRVYIPISCVHTQNGFNVGYVPMTPGVKVVGHSIKPSDAIYGRTAIPVGTKRNPMPHPAYFPPNTLGEVAITEAMELTLGARTTGRTNQYHTDMYMREGGKQWPVKATSKWRSVRKFFRLKESEAAKNQTAGMNPYYAGHYTEAVDKEHRGNRNGLVEAMQSGVYIKQTRELFNEFKEKVATRVQPDGGIDPAASQARHFDEELYTLLLRYKEERTAEARDELIAELKRRGMDDRAAVIEHGDERLGEERVNVRFRAIIDKLYELADAFEEDSIERNAVGDTIKTAESIGAALGEIIAARGEVGEIVSDILPDIPGGVRGVVRDFNLVTNFLKESVDERQPALKPALAAIGALAGDLEQWLKAPERMFESATISPSAIAPQMQERIQRSRDKYDTPQGRRELAASEAVAEWKSNNKPTPQPLPEAREPGAEEEIVQAREPVRAREKDPMACWRNLLDAKNAGDVAAQHKAAEDLVHTDLFSALPDDEKANRAQAWVDLANSRDFDELNGTLGRAAQNQAAIAELTGSLEADKDRLKNLSVKASTQKRFFRPLGKNGWIPIALGWKAGAANYAAATTTVGAYAGTAAAIATTAYSLPFTALLTVMGLEQGVGGVYGKKRVGELLDTMREYEKGLAREKSALETVHQSIATVLGRGPRSGAENPNVATVVDPKHAITADLVNGAMGQIEKQLRHTQDRVKVLKHNHHAQIRNIAAGGVLTAIGAVGLAAGVAGIVAATGAEGAAAAASAGAVLAPLAAAP